MTNNAYSNLGIALILSLYPMLLFAVQGGMNAALILLAGLCLFISFRQRSLPGTQNIDSHLFGFTMSSALLAILFSQLYHHDLQARHFDSAARFLLAIPVFMALRNTDLRVLRVIQFAFPLGAITALLLVLAGANYMGTPRAGTSFINSIHFGNLALILGFLGAFSINWHGKDAAPLLALKVVGLLSGLVASVLSGSRGGWVSIPFFVLLWLLSRSPGKVWNKLAVGIAGSALIVISSYFLVETIQLRLDEIYSDLATFSRGNTDTSIGLRLQLWNAAIQLFLENSLFGVGAEGFGQAMDQLRNAGYLTPLAAEMGKAEVHNEMLSYAVRYGIFGLISILAIYFMPFVLFLRAARSDSESRRGAAVMGMCLTLGFFIFGLTVEMFTLKMTASFYSLSVAVLLAIACNRQDSGNKSNTNISRM
ncbi:MAG: O-antigen ligase family protein [Gallionella sp.]